MRTSDDRAVIDWLIGLFPVVPRRGTRLAFMFTDLEGFTAHAAVRGARCFSATRTGLSSAMVSM